MKKIVFILLALLLAQAQAAEVAGVKVDDTVQIGSHHLVLNGTGMRSKFLVDVYVASLYLSKKINTAEAVLADPGAKRISLHMVRDVGSRLFFDGLNSSILANHTEDEMAALEPKVAKLLKFISTIAELKKGEVLNLDYIPGLGTKILINGVERGVIEGVEFYPALLKIWVGHKPVNKGLRHILLGGEE